jgi:parvulin-like peptidyl-prolyl isomerase
MIRKCAFFILLILISGIVWCENASVVMVGNKVVLGSDVRVKMREENVDYEEALRRLIFEKLLLLQAEKEGMQVYEGEIDYEINRIIKNFPDERTFFQQMEKENVPYYLFRKKIADKIKVNKLVRKNVTARFEITPVEISRKMEEIEGIAGYSYYFKKKSFENESLAKDFISIFDEKKEEEMDDAVWMNSEEILPEVLKEFQKTVKGELSSPVKVDKGYLVFLLKDIKKYEIDAYVLYKRAKNVLSNIKFSEEFDRYIKELQAKTPVVYPVK